MQPSIRDDASSVSNTIVIIPAYNESRFIGSVVLQAKQYAAAVIVVDDGSTDATARIALEAGAVVLNHEHNKGKGFALNTGFQHVRNLPADYIEVKAIVIMDGDGQHQAGDIPNLVKPIVNGDADIVVGSRFLDVKSQIPRWRVVGQHALTLATNISSGFNLTDSQCGFRSFSPHALDVLNFNSQGFSVESEMQFLARERGMRIIEVPISCLYDTPSKRNPFRHGLDVLNGILRMVGQHRPLFFLGGGGLITLIAGLLWGGYVVDIYTRVHVLAVGYALISVLLTILGSLGLFTGIMLHSVRGQIMEIRETIERMKIVETRETVERLQVMPVKEHLPLPPEMDLIKLRILLVLQYYYPYVGGLETLFKQLAEGLVARGHTVHVVSTRLRGSPRSETINGVKVERVATPRFADRYFFTLFSLPVALRFARQCDIVHTTPYNGAPPAYFAARLTRRPVIFTALEVLGRRWLKVEKNLLKAWAYRSFEKMVTKLPYDRYVAISQATLDDCIASGMPARQGHVIYPGVDEAFKRGPRTGALHTRCGIPPEAFVYLYFGRPGITKGVDYLLKAAPMIQREIPHAHLVLILAEQPRAQFLERRQLADRIGAAANIHFLPSQPRPMLIEYLRDADCIVVPSLTEGFGLTAAEAAALGKPVIATRAGSLPEAVSGRYVLVEPGSAEAIAEAVVRVVRGDWEESPLKTFTWDAMVSAYEALYQEMMT